MSCTQPVSVPNAPSARDVETGAKLARDAGAILLQYSAYDYGLAGVITDVSAGWQRVRDLSVSLPRDDALQTAIARGLSFVVAAKAEKRSLVTAGPFGTAAEAQQAFRAMGSPRNGTITQAAPFVI